MTAEHARWKQEAETWLADKCTKGCDSEKCEKYQFILSVIKELEEKELESIKLRGALKKYGEHYLGCPVGCLLDEHGIAEALQLGRTEEELRLARRVMTEGCTCGLDSFQAPT